MVRLVWGKGVGEDTSWKKFYSMEMMIVSHVLAKKMCYGFEPVTGNLLPHILEAAFSGVEN